MKLNIKENKHQVMKSELLQVAEIVAKDKEISREEILKAMEEAILPSAQLRYGNRKHLIVNIDRFNGSIIINWVRTVVDEIKDEDNEILLREAKRFDVNAKVGDKIKNKLPSIEFSRSMVASSRQIIMQKIKTAERNNQIKEFQNRIGDIITGVVNRVDYSEIIIDIGKTSGIIRKSETIPNEVFKMGDRIKVLLCGLNKDPSMPLLQLSRTHPDFLKKLFAQEVPEVYDDIIKIVSVARDPGSKAKVAVMTNDPNIDCIGACVGPKGVRVQSVSEELKGEKIDIIKWSDDIAVFIVNSLSPARVTRVIIDETEQRVDAVVPNDQLSAAIGRRGQNIRLASKLTGWAINAITEEADLENRNKETSYIIKLFKENLDVDEIMAHVLLNEGYVSISEIANSSIEELMSIDGFDSDIANEIQQRAMTYLENKKKALLELCKEKNVSDDLMNYELIRPELLEVLVNAGILKLDDLGDLSTDELLEISDGLLTKKEASTLILKVREKWFS